MNVLEVDSVRKQYGTKTALDGVSWSMPEGYVVGLVGPNGAGKTTLIKAVLNIVGIDGGRISVFDMPHDAAERTVRSRIGFVHESSYLFEDLSARRHERILQAAYPTWRPDRFSRYLSRFDLPPTDPVKRYSKGMKMRLAVAMALSHEAELIIMDEPASGLDPVVRRDLLAVIGEELEQEPRSFLISTHITSDLDRIADYIVVLNEGRVSLSESRESLMDRYAICKGGLDLLENSGRQLFCGIHRSEFGFIALTRDRDAVRTHFGERVVLDRPSIEDLVVHLAREELHESALG